jgi:hypothetical protein
VSANGTLTSPEFTINRRFISFKIQGGGDHRVTGIRLLVDGKPVRTRAGRRAGALQWQSWDVQEFEGQEARLQIYDEGDGYWSYITVDQIELRDTPRPAREGKLDDQEDAGTMALGVLPGPGETLLSTAADVSNINAVFTSVADQPVAADQRSAEGWTTPVMAAGRRLKLDPGQSADVTLVYAWNIPNPTQWGVFYSTRFDDAADAIAFTSEHYDRLTSLTRLWRDTWYDSTLPRWLLDRLMSTASTLSTNTVQWWRNGRLWAWEGEHSCPGTCTHVWNYAHSMARLFPRLERSCRTMQDYGPGYHPESGLIGFRAESLQRYAADGQSGVIIRTYREHQMSPDDDFLRPLWPKVKKALEYMIARDAYPDWEDGPHHRNKLPTEPPTPGEPDGIIEGNQHNTYDCAFNGPNTMIGSLYLAALRSGEEMARDMGDDDFAERCRRLYESGRKLTMERLFNGEYFIQPIPDDYPEAEKYQGDHEVGRGVLADQLFGQTQAYQVGLGDLYPPDAMRSALEAIFRYNWAADVWPQCKVDGRCRRPFARDGEPGLINCTWPFDKHFGLRGPLYNTEVWTGVEYQVAASMVELGLVDKALIICRAIHDRQQPQSNRNPFEEMECGKHYSRAMASYAVYLALCGWEYHGPRGHLGFAPVLQPDDFRSSFTAAEGWGTISQQREAGKQTDRLTPHYGRVRLETLAFELPDGATLQGATVKLADQTIPADAKQNGRRVEITLEKPITVETGKTLAVELSM